MLQPPYNLGEHWARRSISLLSSLMQPPQLTHSTPSHQEGIKGANYLYCALLVSPADAREFLLTANAVNQAPRGREAGQALWEGEDDVSSQDSGLVPAHQGTCGG